MALSATQRSLLKKEWNSNQSFPTIRKLLKMFVGEGVETNGLCEAFRPHLWFSWLCDGKLSWITLLLLDSSTGFSSSGCLCLMLLSPWLDPFSLLIFFLRKWTSFWTKSTSSLRVPLEFSPKGPPSSWAISFGSSLLGSHTQLCPWTQ